jgi:dTDP-4-amino-4,6-dideoxygalactose transaminase
MIPFLDLAQTHQPHTERVLAAMSRVAQSGWYVLGREVETFEQAWAAYCGTQHCIGVANGLDALTLTLKAWNLLPNSEVIVAANAYVAAMLAITHAGLKPVLVEPDKATFNLDPANVEAAITQKTRVILCVHLYGRCCNMTAINAIAERYNLLVLEDAAQAHGAMHNGKRAGNLGHAAGFSFYPTKNLGALGDAGAITTNNDDLADQLRYWRNYGSGQKYHTTYLGHNSRLDELQAAILTEKLAFLTTENAIRRSIAAFYLTNINNPALVLPPTDAINSDVWHLFVVRHANRDRFREYLKQNGIGTDVHYPVPPHRQPAFPQWHSLSFPISDELHRTVVSLPLNPALTIDQIAHVVTVINQWN